MPFRSKPAYFKARSTSDPSLILVLCRQNKRWLTAVLKDDTTEYRYGTLIWNPPMQQWVLRSGEHELMMGPKARTGLVDVPGFDLVATTWPTAAGDWMEADVGIIESLRQWALDHKMINTLDLHSKDRRADLGLA